MDLQLEGKRVLITGASKGIVLHYFRSKQELFEQAMREANANLRDAVAENLKQARTPYERLIAIVDTNFDPRLFQPSVAHAWLSLCAEVPREAQLARDRVDPRAQPARPVRQVQRDRRDVLEETVSLLFGLEGKYGFAELIG